MHEGLKDQVVNLGTYQTFFVINRKTERREREPASGLMRKTNLYFFDIQQISLPDME